MVYRIASKLDSFSFFFIDVGLGYNITTSLTLLCNYFMKTFSYKESHIVLNWWTLWKYIPEPRGQMIKEKVWDANTFQVWSICCMKLNQIVLDTYTNMVPAYDTFAYLERWSICGLHLYFAISLDHSISLEYFQINYKSTKSR